eukprot:TRINITY_DN5218_c0_g1_i3.p1 TRINITY_DN5218_c0_g1~~TRINITY_DN5218_c0_g1_i3.p1  ORF type:complete len:723 (-),score=111.20 TRINITY_DN5218_c0_g1_i3:188-2356(-)
MSEVRAVRGSAMSEPGNIIRNSAMTNDVPKPPKQRPKAPKTSAPMCIADPPTLRPRCEPAEQLRLLQQALDSSHRQAMALVSNVLSNFDTGGKAPFRPRSAFRASQGGGEVDTIKSDFDEGEKQGRITPFSQKDRRSARSVLRLDFNSDEVDESLKILKAPAEIELHRWTFDSVNSGSEFKHKSTPCLGLPDVPFEHTRPFVKPMSVHLKDLCATQTDPTELIKEPLTVVDTQRDQNMKTRVAARDIKKSSTVPEEAFVKPGTELSERRRTGRRTRVSYISRDDVDACKGVQALRSRAVFNDKSEMLEKILSDLGEEDYDVRAFYKTNGWFQAVARSQGFEYFTHFVIFLNSIWIAIECDLNDKPVLVNAAPIFIILENLFCVFFLGEWVIRLLALDHPISGFRDTWFIFDMVLAGCMIFDTWILSVILLTVGTTSASGSAEMDNTSLLKLFRLLRLTRTARMVRLLHFFPELMVMCKGLMAAFRSVATTLCLLLVIVYVFSIAFRQVTDGTPMGQRWFKSVPAGMLHLIVYGVVPDVEELLMGLSSESVMSGVLVFTFVLTASITVLNLLVGVLVEAVSVVAMVEKESTAARFVKSALSSILLEVEGASTEEREISKDEFEILASRRDFAKVMSEVGVDIADFVSLSEWLFKGGKNVPLGEFFKLIMQLRGSNFATVKDVVDMRKYLTDVMEHIEEVFRTISSDRWYLDDKGRYRKCDQAW